MSALNQVALSVQLNFFKILHMYLEADVGIGV